MSHLSLQMLTWGTIAGAVASAVLLAASDNNGQEFRFEAPSAGSRVEQRLHELRSELARAQRPAHPASDAAVR